MLTPKDKRWWLKLFEKRLNEIEEQKSFLARLEDELLIMYDKFQKKEEEKDGR